MTALTLALTAGGVSLVLSALLPWAVRPLLVRLGIMDVPNERSSHDRPVIRGLGLAVLLATGAGGAVGVWQLITPSGTGWKLLLVVLSGLIAAGLLGLREDLRGLSVVVRSLWLLGIAAASAILVAWLAARPSGCGCAAGVGPLACPRWWFGMPLSRHRVLSPAGLPVPTPLFFQREANVAGVEFTAKTEILSSCSPE